MIDTAASEQCLFCKIIRKEIPSAMVFEDADSLVILDKFPATRGQALVLSKEHVGYVLDLDDRAYGHLWNVARRVGKALDEALKTERTCFVVEGFEIPHVHIRLHPCYNRVLRVKGSAASDEALQETAARIRQHLAPV